MLDANEDGEVDSFEWTTMLSQVWLHLDLTITIVHFLSLSAIISILISSIILSSDNRINQITHRSAIEAVSTLHLRNLKTGCYVFLQLGLPSALIRHENALQTEGVIWKRRIFVFAWTENATSPVPRAFTLFLFRKKKANARREKKTTKSNMKM